MYKNEKVKLTSTVAAAIPLPALAPKIMGFAIVCFGLFHIYFKKNPGWVGGQK